MKKLCVIFGGASAEHDVSIITGMQLAKIVSQKMEIEKIYLGLDNKFYLATKIDDISFFTNKQNITLPEIIINSNSIYKKGFINKKLFDIDCVINCCHGGVGENGNLAAFFEINNILYTSSNPLSSKIAMDKNLAKTMLKEIVPTIKSVFLTEQNKEHAIKTIEKTLGKDLIVKPNSLGSSIGVKVCNKKDYIQQAEAIFLMHDDVLVEEQITNLIEYNQACIKDGEKLILSAIESPLTNNNFLTFDDKYLNNQKGKDRVVGANINDELAKKINTYTTSIYKKLNFNGVVRIDYILDKTTNKLYFNEANTIPGSMAYYLFEPVGIDYIGLVEILIKNATQPKQYTYFNSDILSNKNI